MPDEKLQTFIADLVNVFGIVIAQQSGFKPTMEQNLVSTTTAATIHAQLRPRIGAASTAAASPSSTPSPQ